MEKRLSISEVAKAGLTNAELYRLDCLCLLGHLQPAVAATFLGSYTREELAVALSALQKLSILPDLAETALNPVLDQPILTSITDILQLVQDQFTQKP